MLRQLFVSVAARKKINSLKQEAREFIKNSALPNGAIVTVNSEKYPEEKNKELHFVFPEEAALACLTGPELGLTGIQEPFLRWLEKTENLASNKLLYQSYSANGLIKQRKVVSRQNAVVLWVIYKLSKKNILQAEKFENLTNLLAKGLLSLPQSQKIHKLGLFCAYKLTRDKIYLPGSQKSSEKIMYNSCFDNFSAKLSINDLLMQKSTTLSGHVLFLLRAKRSGLI